MSLRRHCGSKLHNKTGKTRSATANPLLRGGDRYGGMVHALVAMRRSGANRRRHLHAAAETPTIDRRNNVLRTRSRAPALHHGGAIDGKGTPGRRQIGKGITRGGIHDDSNPTKGSQDRCRGARRHGRHPGHRPPAGFCPGHHGPLAALERLRAGVRSAAAQGAFARRRESAGDQGQFRDRQRQRPAAAHHLGNPVRRRSRHHHALQQPPADLFGERHRYVRPRRQHRQGRRGLLRFVQVEHVGRPEVHRPCRGPSSAP